MVTVRNDNIYVYINLNNGFDSSGNRRTIPIGFGGVLDSNTYDVQKVMNIVDALSPLFSKSVSSVNEVRVNTLI